MGNILAAAMALAMALVPAPSGAVEIDRLDGTHVAPAEIDRVVTSLMKAGHVPGLALGIVDHGRIVYLHAYGFRDVAAREPLQTDTVMHAASLTEAAFAYMVMQLVDQHRIDLDKPVYEYLPRPLPSYAKYADFANDPRYKLITARMLLAHTSGLPNWRSTNPDGKLDIAFAPGTRYAYSGEGINLLQFALEEGLGMNVATLMQQLVFDRFGMSRSSLTWQAAYAGNTATGYDAKGVTIAHKERDEARAADSMDTTIADYTSFVAGVLRGEGLSAGARAQMFEPQIAIASMHQFPTESTLMTDANQVIGLSYGLGWGLLTTPLGPAYFKEGHDDGTENYAVSFDRAKLGIVIMTDSSNGESIFKYLLANVIGDTYTPWFWESYFPYDYTGPR
jgi:CubicO group peptidase (beta-lactamase class C family)